MAQKDLLVAHLQDTTTSIGGSNSKKAEKIRQATLLVLGAFVFGIIFSVAQMRQRDKVDALAVKEGKIPAITLGAK